MQSGPRLEPCSAEGRLWPNLAVGAQRSPAVGCRGTSGRPRLSSGSIALSRAARVRQREPTRRMRPGLGLLPGHCLQQPETHLPFPSNSMVRSLIAR
jgi:hypothetical protein